MKKLNCWNCNAEMKKIVDNFQGFKVNAWKCVKCKDIVYDETDIQPIQLYHITKGKNIEFELEPEAIRLKI